MAEVDPLNTADLTTADRGRSWPRPDSTMSTRSVAAASASCIRCAQRSLDRSVRGQGAHRRSRAATTLSDSCASSGRWAKLSGHPHIVSVFAGRRDRVGSAVHRDAVPPGWVRWSARIHTVGPLDWRDAVHIGVEWPARWRRRTGSAPCIGTSNPATSCSPSTASRQLTDFGIARIAGGFETADGRGDRVAGVHRTGGAAGRNADRRPPTSTVWAPRCSARSPVTRFRTPQRRAGGRPVSADRQATDPGPARGGHPRRRVRRHRAGHVPRDRRPSRRPRPSSASCCGRCSNDTACRSTRCPYPSLRAERMTALGDAADPR